MLSIVATPIGNLKDITIRAIETLTSADAIVCEDTREAGKLLSELKIPKKELLSLHSYSSPSKLQDVVLRLKRNENIALISDRGTPGISDPGYALVKAAYENDIEVHVIPGPSAFLAALSVSGLPINHFLYLGFLPQKKGRKSLLASLRDEERTIVFYESVHRIARTLQELSNILIDQPHRPVVIARELTKIYEEVIRTNVENLPSISSTLTQKGEFVVIIGGKERS